MGLQEAAEMLIYRSLIPEKKGNAELQVWFRDALLLEKRENVGFSNGKMWDFFLLGIYYRQAGGPGAK